MPLPLGPLILHSLQLGYLGFHFSVAVTIAVQVAKKNSDFFKGFYILYVIQSFFDVCSLLVVSAADVTDNPPPYLGPSVLDPLAILRSVLNPNP